MATTETTTVVHARHVHDRDRLFFEGVTGAEDEYGVVEIVRTTTTQRYTAESVTRGGRNRIGEPVIEVEVLARLDAEAAAALIRTLGTALVGALEVRPGHRVGRA